MSRRTRTSPAAIALDMGTAVRRARGDVMVEDAPDPDAPKRTIRRARAVWAPDVLLRTQAIDKQMHDAAVRYMDSYQLGVLGAKDRSMVFVSRSGSPGGMAEARLAAVTDWRKATQAVGIILSPILTWCVLGHGTLRGYAADCGGSREAAHRSLLAALDRLADHFGRAQ